MLSVRSIIRATRHQRAFGDPSTPDEERRAEEDRLDPILQRARREKTKGLLKDSSTDEQKER